MRPLCGLAQLSLATVLTGCTVVSVPAPNVAVCVSGAPQPHSTSLSRTVQGDTRPTLQELEAARRKAEAVLRELF